jgi:hypothetical protein
MSSAARQVDESDVGSACRSGRGRLLQGGAGEDPERRGADSSIRAHRASARAAVLVGESFAAPHLVPLRPGCGSRRRRRGPALADGRASEVVLPGRHAHEDVVMTSARVPSRTSALSPTSPGTEVRGAAFRDFPLSMYGGCGPRPITISALTAGTGRAAFSSSDAGQELPAASAWRGQASSVSRTAGSSATGLVRSRVGPRVRWAAADLPAAVSRPGARSGRVLPSLVRRLQVMGGGGVIVIATDFV